MSDLAHQPPARLADGRYVLIERVGSGGAAEVWTARDRDLDVIRAIKLLTLAGSRRATLRRRLRAEAQVLARLDHPHVLRVTDIGTEDERDYLVMDYMPGGSLGDRVQREGPMPVHEAVTAVLEVLSALAAAHGKGVVHRDVKPQNILIAEDGRAVLADFGIALVDWDDRRTRTGVAMGSFAFMPPEQRIDAKRVGPNADLYAAGATLFWLVTGRTPIDLFAADPGTPRYQGVPEDLARAIAWATRASPEDRPQDAAEFAQALRELAPESVRTRLDLDPDRFPPPSPTLLPVTATESATATPAPIQAASTETLTVSRPGRRLTMLALVLAILAALLLLGFSTWQVLGSPGLSTRAEVMTVEVIPPSIGEPLGPEAFLPAPTVEPGRTARAAVVDRAAFARRWSGSFDGRPASLALAGGPSDLHGTWTVRFDGNAVVSDVRGQWLDGGRRLLLEDATDAGDSGRYDARRVGTKLQGTFKGRYRDVIVPFSLSAEIP